MLFETGLAVRNRQVHFKLELDPEEASDNWIVSHLQKMECYEPDITHVMLRVVREGDCVVDVGAHNGFFTVLLSKLVGPTGRVFAFEPYDQNLVRLRKNIALNDLKNVELITKPVWHAKEQVTFYECKDATGSGSLWDVGLWRDNIKSKANPNPCPMDAVTLDSVIPPGTKVALIKSDTEGVEEHIFRGANRVLRNMPWVLFEFNPIGLTQMGGDQRSLRDLMKMYGYDTFLLHENGLLPSLVPTTSDVVFLNGCVILNAMFSTFAKVANAWPQVPCEVEQ